MHLLSLHTWMKDYWSYHTSQAETTRRQCQQTQGELIAGRTKMSYRDWPSLKKCQICKKSGPAFSSDLMKKSFCSWHHVYCKFGLMRPNEAKLCKFKSDEVKDPGRRTVEVLTTAWQSVGAAWKRHFHFSLDVLNFLCLHLRSEAHSRADLSACV